MANPIKDLVESTISSVNGMFSADNIIGETVTAPDGTMIIPISKVSFGVGVNCGDAVVGNIGCDFRMDAVDNANRLGLLIDDVLASTGSEKVNIIAQSYGGQIAGTYLSLHADDAGEKINNCVMLVPALGGATLAYDFFADEMRLDEENLAEYLEYGFMSETDFHILLKITHFFNNSLYTL